jgi:chromosome segregation ATPase
MTPEERFERIEQKIEFIVNQQAQFAIDLQALREELQQSHAVLQNQINRLNEAVLGLVGMVGRLAEAQAKTEARMVEVAEGMRKLEEKGAETEERLNIFINVVERYLSERQKGESEET